MDLIKTNMTGMFIFVCAVILSTFVNNPYADARQERVDLQAGEQRYIQSPNYPSFYPNSADMRWLVKVPPAYQVMLHFIDFKTYYFDTLTVHDGWRSDFLSLTQRAVLYGNSVPADIISQGSYLSVHFKSNAKYTDKGFQARLSAELRTIILNTEGTKILNSPNYPNPYDNNIDAIWQVVAPVGYRVRIRFTDFSTEENDDVVAVNEGWTSNYSRSTLRVSLSGLSIPTNVISQGSYLWVRFTSDNDINWNQYGFRALLSAVRAIILNPEGTEVLTSPNYPEPYENNIDTIWYVRAPAGYRVLLRFSNITTEETYDTVTVKDGWTSNYSRSMLRASLFEPSIPNNITSIGSHLWIQFKSDRKNEDTGFRALLHAVIPVVILQTNETQILTSPNFPSGYDNNIDVVWHVAAPSGYRIMVHFSEFYTESERDLVYLYDGKTSEFQSSSLRGNLSGSYVPRNITTVGAYLWIRFTSDDWYYRDHTGFEALLMTVETTVPTTLTSTMHPTTTQGQPSTHASTSVIPSPSSTKVGSAMKKSPMSHRSVLAISLVAVAVLLCVCVAGCVGWRKRLRHGTSQGIAAFGDSKESHGIGDNPIFESSNVHDLRMSDDADRQCGNDPYMALTTPHDGPTLQVYEPLREVNSEGDGYEVPINGTNGQTGPEYGKTLHKLQVHLETDYEITHEYQDLTNSVVGRNNSHSESPVCGFQVQPETEIHEYEDPGMIGENIPQYESHINVLQRNI